MNKSRSGFTIVELLIVIVVIGILAAITIVAYNGVQNKANETAVQSDLRNVGGRIASFKTEFDRLPVPNASELGSFGIKVSSKSYGAHYLAGGLTYNFLYCYTDTTTSAGQFILVAAATSGKVLIYKDGGVKVGVGPLVTYTTTCSNNGLVTPTSTWMYSSGDWPVWFK